MRKLEIDNITAMIEKPISKDGRVCGLKDWKNKKAIIIIQENKKRKDE
jgi:hypothetical protein